MEVESPESLILDVLQRASSQDPSILKPAETKLKEWEVQPGFHSTLLTVISNHNLDINVRWIAVLYMKNGVDKYWRKNAPVGALSEQEKESIRQGLLSNFSEPITQIAVQRAVLISKIARFDFPKEWPQLFPILIQAIESPDSLVQYRAILTLHHVIKAVSSKRLAGDKRNFQELTGNVYRFCLNLWNTFTEAFIRDIMDNHPIETTSVNLDKALLFLRILRKLTINGYQRPQASEDCVLFFKTLFEKAKIVLQCRVMLKSKGGQILETCEKFVIHMTKVLLSLLEISPYAFVDLIQPSLEFAVFYLFTNEGVQFLFERFVIQCFNLIKNILLCVEYKPAKIPEMTKHPMTLKANQIIEAFFQPDLLKEMCRKLVTHYFILTPEELAVWDEDPEAFSNDETGDSWKYSLRPSMESVYVTLFHKYNSILTPIMMELIYETNVLVSPDDMQGILRKDAIYNAVGLCAFELYDSIDFDSWFTNTLLQEVKIKHHNYRIIRRSVSAMIGHWTSVKLSTELRPTLYECLISLLGPEENMAVRLTACSTLRHAIDDFDFYTDQFKDYLYPTFNLLYNLLKEASECETKMHVLNVMTLMLDRMGPSLTPYTDSLIQYLPHLWQESEEHNMLRCCIVSTLVQVVRALEGCKPELYPFLLPIIQLGTDINRDAIVYLLEDCLNLWLIVLEFTSSINNDFLQLFNNMPSLLEYSTENFRVCLQICIVQLLIDPPLFMRSHGLQIMTVCDNMISDLRNEGIIMILRLVELIIKSNPVLGSETVMPILPRIVQRLCNAEDYNMVLSMQLVVVARVLISSHDVFRRTLINVAQQHNKTEEFVLENLLNIWLDKMSNIQEGQYVKLLGMALANLLTTQSRAVYERFDKIMIHILEALNDVTSTNDDGTQYDFLLLTDGQSPSMYIEEDSSRTFETDHDQRRQQLILSDPVHTVIFRDYLQSQVAALKNQIGLQSYEQLFQTVDADTMYQLKEYISI